MREPRRKGKKQAVLAAQRSETGELIYRPGRLAASGRPEDDLAGVKPPKNKAETQCFEELQKSGWTPTKRGWPDFFCVKGDQVCAVEVKPKKSHKLKPNQIAVMGYLSAAGIRCFLWSPDGGFEEVMGKETSQDF